MISPPRRKNASPPRRSDAKQSSYREPGILSHKSQHSATFPAIPDHRREFIEFDVLLLLLALRTNRSSGVICFSAGRIS